ncbi:MAG: lysozyme [Nereida ignava]
MRINQATIDLVKEFEGLRLEAYLDPVGVVTIGYGYTNRAGFGPGVAMGDVWTEAQAEEYLAEGLVRFANGIRPHFDRDATPNQFGAMLSLAYNIGTGAFSRSTCLKRFNAGDIEGAADALTWFNKAGGKVLRGLVRRREAERVLFLSDIPSRIDRGSAVRPDGEKQKKGSTTLWGTLVAAVSGGGGVVTAIGQLEGQAQTIVLGFAGLAVLSLIWIARERIKKLADGI